MLACVIIWFYHGPVFNCFGHPADQRRHFSIWVLNSISLCIVFCSIFLPLLIVQFSAYRRVYIRYLLRFFDCLTHPNLSATFATDQKWPICHLCISYQSLAGSLSSLQKSEILKLIISLFRWFWCQNWDQWHKMSEKNTHIYFFYFWFKN